MPKPVRELASAMRTDLLSAKAVRRPAVSVGFTSGLGLVVAQVAFGSLIVSGALAPYSSQGVGLVLFGNFAACLILAPAGRYRGTIAGLSPALVIVMATIGASVDAEGEARFVTTAGPLVIGAMATGVCCLLLGRFRLGNLVRLSNKARPVPDRAILKEEGERVHAYRLRGAVRPACLLLDFSAVSGFDFSAVSVVSRFLQTANAAGVQVVLSALSEKLKAGLEPCISAAAATRSGRARWTRRRPPWWRANPAERWC